MDPNIANRAKEIWEKSPQHSIEYDSFIKRLQALANGSPRTFKALARDAGLMPRTEYTAREQAEREFVAYDGEGFEDKYTLLANSFGETIVDRNGLSSIECLRFLAQKYDRPIFRVFYGFDYDINHIVADLPRRKLEALLDGKLVVWNGFRLHYYAGKIFEINNILYYDVVAFFQRSFLSTVKLMLGESAISQKLIEGKAARGDFQSWTDEDIIAYNAEELTLLVRVMERFRESLANADVKLSQWYGPGAIANLWMRRHNIVTPKVPDEVEKALDLAYYGGRFEQVRLGKTKGVYEYDIRSAYPAAMSTMPTFERWYHSDRYVPDTDYAVWHVNVDMRTWYLLKYMGIDPLTRNFQSGDEPSHANAFLPLPMRNRAGVICFPLIARGWYWAKELQLVYDFFPDARIEVLEGYIADTRDDRPFSWVEDMYEYRRQLKAEGNMSEYGVKVGLNSLYGKTAQRVGKARYHSLAWAGYITSSVRAKIARAGYSAGGNKRPETNASRVIGFATDAIFSSHPLNLDVSNRLGEWEEKRFTEGLFIQSGIYRASNAEETIDRYRGNPMRDGLDDIIAQLKEFPVLDPYVWKQIFVSHKLANAMPRALGPHRLRFVRTRQSIYIALSVKRHYMFPMVTLDGDTYPYLAYMLNHPIYSLPKVYMDSRSYTSETFDADLTANNPDDGVESYLSNKSVARLLSDKVESVDIENPFDSLATLLQLPEEKILEALMTA